MFTNIKKDTYLVKSVNVLLFLCFKYISLRKVSRNIKNMITIFILTRDFRTNCSPNNRNNPEWLRAMDKRGGSFNIAAPYPKNDYFRRSFIEPLLDDCGYIREEFWGIPLTTSDGISYCIKKWHKNQYKESFT